ncbi:uncharacterized protein TRIREDRAFT_70918, partial [Trichoderma reesei QM6a]
KTKRKTYNSRCSLVVTHPTTNLPVSGLSMGEQTGPRVFHYLWSYVLVFSLHQLICDATLDAGLHQRQLNTPRYISACLQNHLTTT